jgi:hypothetical protein
MPCPIPDMTTLAVLKEFTQGLTVILLDGSLLFLRETGTPRQCAALMSIFSCRVNMCLEALVGNECLERKKTGGRKMHSYELSTTNPGSGSWTRMSESHVVMLSLNPRKNPNMAVSQNSPCTGQPYQLFKDEICIIKPYLYHSIAYDCIEYHWYQSSLHIPK